MKLTSLLASAGLLLGAVSAHSHHHHHDSVPVHLLGYGAVAHELLTRLEHGKDCSGFAALFAEGATLEGRADRRPRDFCESAREVLRGLEPPKVFPDPARSRVVINVGARLPDMYGDEPQDVTLILGVNASIVQTTRTEHGAPKPPRPEDLNGAVTGAVVVVGGIPLDLAPTGVRHFEALIEGAFGGRRHTLHAPPPPHAGGAPPHEHRDEAMDRAAREDMESFGGRRAGGEGEADMLELSELEGNSTMWCRDLMESHMTENATIALPGLWGHHGNHSHWGNHTHHNGTLAREDAISHCEERWAHRHHHHHHHHRHSRRPRLVPGSVHATQLPGGGAVVFWEVEGGKWGHHHHHHHHHDHHHDHYHGEGPAMSDSADVPSDAPSAALQTAFEAESAPAPAEDKEEKGEEKPDDIGAIDNNPAIHPLPWVRGGDMQTEDVQQMRRMLRAEEGVQASHSGCPWMRKWHWQWPHFGPSFHPHAPPRRAMAAIVQWDESDASSRLSSVTLLPLDLEGTLRHHKTMMAVHIALAVTSLLAILLASCCLVRCCCRRCKRQQQARLVTPEGVILPPGAALTAGQASALH